MSAPLQSADLTHAEVMDRMYGPQRHFYDATRAYYLLGRDMMLDQLNVPQGGSVLEVGCGTGRNLAGVARRQPSAQLFGFDISREMLRSAASTLNRTGALNRTHLARADASTFDAQTTYGVAGFDRVFFSYTLSMIPDWESALWQGFAAVNPGGSMHMVDFGDCGQLPGFFKSGLSRWLKRFHVTPRLELENALQALIGKAGGRIEVASTFRGYAVVAKVTRR